MPKFPGMLRAQRQTSDETRAVLGDGEKKGVVLVTKWWVGGRRGMRHRHLFQIEGTGNGPRSLGEQKMCQERRKDKKRRFHRIY